MEKLAPSATHAVVPLPRARFDDFFHGRWQALVRASESGQTEDDATKRADRAVRLARVGELSAARQALMADPLPPRHADTLRADTHGPD